MGTIRKKESCIRSEKDCQKTKGGKKQAFQGRIGKMYSPGPRRKKRNLWYCAGDRALKLPGGKGGGKSFRKNELLQERPRPSNGKGGSRG